MSTTVSCRKERFEDVYEIKQELGRGQFAVVKKCISKENNMEVAAKFIKLKRSKASKTGLSKELVEREARILFSVNHSKIIKLYDFFDIGAEMVLVLELLSGGELFDKICECEFLKEVDACFYMKQVLEAVHHIHSLNIVHLDIKPENIVLQSKQRSEIKLVDFGLAQKLIPGEELKEMMGTPEFVAPEIVNYEAIGCYTDMWAVGVLAFILLSGCSPFLGENNQETYEAIVQVDYEFDDESFEQISSHAKDFISSLLVKQPSKRLTAEECLKHDWLVFMSAPRARTESVFITTAKLKRYLAKRRWQQSFQKLNAINRFSKFMKKGTTLDEEKISDEVSLKNYSQENLSLSKNMEVQSICNLNGNLFNGAAPSTNLLSLPFEEDTSEILNNICIPNDMRNLDETNTEKSSAPRIQLVTSPTLPIYDDFENNNRKISVAKRKYSREVQVRYTELQQRKEENFVLIASEEITEEKSDQDTPNKLTEIQLCQKSDANAMEDSNQNTDPQNEDSQDQTSFEEKADNFETPRRSSFRKKAILIDHKNLVNNQLSERKDRSVSFTESKRMDIIHDCEVEEANGNKENCVNERKDEIKQSEKKTRKHVICAKTIGMEHLIDIILMDDPKETPVLQQPPIVPVLTSIPNGFTGIKFYKETSV